MGRHFTDMRLEESHLQKLVNVCCSVLGHSMWSAGHRFLPHDQSNARDLRQAFLLPIILITIICGN